MGMFMDGTGAIRPAAKTGVMFPEATQSLLGAVMRKSVLPLLAVFVLVFAVAADRPAAAGSLSIKVDEDRVTLSADDVSLDAVVRRLARSAGFSITFEASLSDKVTLNVEDKPLVSVLKLLLRRHSYVLTFAPAAEGATALMLENLTVLRATKGQGAPQDDVQGVGGVR